MLQPCGSRRLRAPLCAACATRLALRCPPSARRFRPSQRRPSFPSARARRPAPVTLSARFARSVRRALSPARRTGNACASRSLRRPGPLLGVAHPRRRRRDSRTRCGQLCRHLRAQLQCAPAPHFDDVGRALRVVLVRRRRRGSRARCAQLCRRLVAQVARPLASHFEDTAACSASFSRDDAGAAHARGVVSFVDRSARRSRVRSSLTSTTRPPAWCRCPVTTPARLTRAVRSALSAGRRAGCACARRSLRRHGRPLGVVVQ